MTPDSDSSLKIENAVANDVLCYLSTARNSLPRDVIVLNAAAFFKPEKVLQAKEIVYNIYCEKIIVRKKTVNQPYPTSIDLSDILGLMEKHEGDVSPRFLATNFDSLPPNGFESMAAILSSLRDELFSLKAEVCQLKDNNNRDQRTLEDVCCIKQDVADIKVSICHLKAGKNFSKQAAVKSTTPPGMASTESSLTAKPFALSHVVSNEDSGEHHIDLPLYSSALMSSRNMPVSSATTVVSTSESEPLDNNRDNQSRNRAVAASRIATTPVDSEFRQVARQRPYRQRRAKIIGAGRMDGGSLTAAVQSQHDLDIFVGGCSLDSSIEDITVHCVSLNISVRAVSPLVTKAQWYKAYKLTVAADDRDKLLVPEAWPDGIFVRKFFKARVNTSARNINAT